MFAKPAVTVIFFGNGGLLSDCNVASVTVIILLHLSCQTTSGQRPNKIDRTVSDQLPLIDFYNSVPEGHYCLTESRSSHKLMFSELAVSLPLGTKSQSPSPGQVGDTLASILSSNVIVLQPHSQL